MTSPSRHESRSQLIGRGGRLSDRMGGMNVGRRRGGPRERRGASS
ncbi:hypothetical protein F750_6965 [Streptomyces sp. PAMC 26508]|nr:hypothetical protein F750_6965 [Streptomyces sp. PAMC 26508]